MIAAKDGYTTAESRMAMVDVLLESPADLNIQEDVRLRLLEHQFYSTPVDTLSITQLSLSLLEYWVDSTNVCCQ